MAMAKKRQKPDAKFSLKINGRELSGEKRDGRWTFVSPDWPDLDGPRRKGDDVLQAVMDAFVSRALAR